MLINFVVFIIDMEKQHTGYYEGILQLRDPTDEVLDYFDSWISKQKNVSITKAVKLKTGYDFYLTSNKSLLAIGKKLYVRFGGEQKISSKLHTVRRQTSKELYRVTVMFRPPKFKRGDIVEVRGQKLRIKQMKRKVLGIDVESGKKVWFDYGDAR